MTFTCRPIFILTDAAPVAGYRHHQALAASASKNEPALVEVSDNDPYNLIDSSGTAGDAEGIVHMHYVRSAYCTGFASS